MTARTDRDRKTAKELFLEQAEAFCANALSDSGGTAHWSLRIGAIERLIADRVGGSRGALFGLRSF